MSDDTEEASDVQDILNSNVQINQVPNANRFIPQDYQPQLMDQMRVNSPTTNFFFPSAQQERMPRDPETSYNASMAWARVLQEVDVMIVRRALAQQIETNDVIVDNGTQYLLLPMEWAQPLMKLLEVIGRYGKPEGRETLTRQELADLMARTMAAMRDGRGQTIPPHIRQMSPPGMPVYSADAIFIALGILGMIS